MKRVPRPFSAVCLALLFSALTLHAGFSHASESLARSKNCFSCHALDEKLIGPSLRDVAHKYAPTRSAAQDAALAEKIMLGGSGVWGLIPKPPNAQVSLPEAESLVAWIMSLDGTPPPAPEVTRLIPRAGLWWDPRRPGQGFNIEIVADQLILVWYTYDAAGTPVWYLASAPRSEPSWSAELMRFTRYETRTRPIMTADVAGTVTLDLATSTEASLTWQIGDASGTENIDYFTFANDTIALRDRTSANLTGLYFDPDNTGYGLTIVTQGFRPVPQGVESSVGATEMAVLYFYDANGEPRWALGSSDYIPGVEVNVPMNVFRGSCPNCDYRSPTPSAVGSISHLPFLTGVGRFTSSVDLEPAGLTGRWDRVAERFGRMTSQH